MIRIYKYELEEIDGKFYWNDELFSGIIFDRNDSFNGHIFNSKKVCKEGVIVGDYVNKYFSKYIDVKNCLEVHSGSLEEKEVYFDYEAPPSIVLYKNKPFTGIAYNPSGEEAEFVGGEYLHIDGQDDPANIEMEYADNGELIYFSYNEEESYSYNGEQ